MDDPEASRLVADLQSFEFYHGRDQGFWELVEQVSFLVFVRLYAPDGRSYVCRLDCAGYGEEPIAAQFVDEQRQCIESAWPQGNGTFQQWVKCRGANLFVCWDQDRIAVEKHHPDWKARKAWKKNKNQIVGYLDFLRQLLHLPRKGYERASAASIG